MCREPPKFRAALALLVLAFGSGAVRGTSQASSAASDPVAWVVFVDDLHIEFRNTGRIRQLVQTFLNDIVNDEDLVAIRTSGPSGVFTDFSSVREVLSALKELTGGGLRPSELTGLMLRDEKEMPYRARMALSGATAAAALLSQVEPRRRALLYISNGHAFDMKTMIEARALAHVARTGGVRILTLDAASMNRLPPDPVTEKAWETYRAAARESLRVLAEQGDGVAILDVQDARAALEQIRKSIRQ
jgi:hypothetical protein